MIKFGNIITQATSGELAALKQIGGTFDPTADQIWEYYKSVGWRNATSVDSPTEGCRVVRYSVNDLGDGEHCTVTIAEQINIAAEEAARQAAEAVRKNTPEIYDHPIELPALVLTSTPGGIGVGVIAGDDGEVDTFVYHASPIPTPEEIAARKAAAVAARKAHKNRIASIKDDLDSVGVALDAVDKTAFPAGAQRQAIAAFLLATINLKQACEKLT